MQKITIIILFFGAYFTKAQIVIGKSTATNSSVSLEFGTENKGLLLPWVTSAEAVTGSADGTIIFDITDKKVKYKKSGMWSDLTINTNGSVDTSLQDVMTEQTTAGIKIGTNADMDTVPGILVLTDTDKAMILPKVANPHLNIISPSTGMMVYDTTARQLAVFNGAVWTYWKP